MYLIFEIPVFFLDTVRPHIQANHVKMTPMQLGCLLRNDHRQNVYFLRKGRIVLIEGQLSPNKQSNTRLKYMVDNKFVKHRPKSGNNGSTIIKTVLARICESLL